jgi:uncharacterized Zn-binding protein involved in type VI secretion
MEAHFLEDQGCPAMLPIIVLNDPTNQGGLVIEGSPSTFLNGLKVARLGDSVLCPHGLCSIGSGDESVLIDNLPVAREGDRLICGAVLVATHDDLCIV